MSLFHGGEISVTRSLFSGCSCCRVPLVPFPWDDGYEKGCRSIFFGGGPFGCRCDRDPEVLFPWDEKGNTASEEPEEVTAMYSVYSRLPEPLLNSPCFGPHECFVPQPQVGLTCDSRENVCVFGTIPSGSSSDQNSGVLFPWEEKGSATSVEPEDSSQKTSLESEEELKVKTIDFDFSTFTPSLPREDLYPYQHPFTIIKNKFSSTKFLFVDDKNYPGEYPKMDRGTTTFGFIFRDLVFVAADCYPSIPKVVELTSHIVAAISGGSEFVLEEIRGKCENEVNEGRRVTVELASKWLADKVDSLELSVGILIGGWDETADRPVLYHVNCLGKMKNCAENRKTRQIVFATGSGEGACIGYFQGWSGDEISETEAVELAKNTICYAACNALESGDFASVYSVGRSGCKLRIPGYDIGQWQKEHEGDFAPTSEYLRVSAYPPYHPYSLARGPVIFFS